MGARLCMELEMWRTTTLFVNTYYSSRRAYGEVAFYGITLEDNIAWVRAFGD